MKVWWCEEHSNSARVGGPAGYCWITTDSVKAYYSNRCRMVEMQLVPADARMVSGEAIVIEKVDGEWPEWAVDAYEQAQAGYADRVWVREYLDALSVSDPTKTEPPKDPWDYDP